MAHLLDTFTTHLLTTVPSRQQRQATQQQQQQNGIAAGLPKGLPMPATGLKQDWLSFVAALPDADQPAVLGLPANIERSIALGQSRRLLASLRQIGAAQVGLKYNAGMHLLKAVGVTCNMKAWCLPAVCAFLGRPAADCQSAVLRHNNVVVHAGGRSQWL